MANEKKIDYLILGLLSHEDLTGYDIKKRLDTRLSFFWNASYGSIYPSLANLEKLNMVNKKTEKDNGRDKIIYSILDKGKEYLNEWLANPVIKDELRYETLLKLFFGNEVDNNITIRHIINFQKKIKENLAILEICVNQLSCIQDENTHIYYLLTARFGVKTYKAYLEWCEEALNTLRGVK